MKRAASLLVFAFAAFACGGEEPCHVERTAGGGAVLACPGEDRVPIGGGCTAVDGPQGPLLRCPGRADVRIAAGCRLGAGVLECEGRRVPLPGDERGSVVGNALLGDGGAGVITVAIEGTTLAVRPAEDGSFRFDGLQAGPVTLLVHAPGYLPERREVKLLPGTFELGQILLWRTRFLAPGVWGIYDWAPGARSALVPTATGTAFLFLSDGYLLPTAGTTAQFSPDGHFAVSGGRLFDLEGRQSRPISEARSAAFLSDGSSLALLGDGEVTLLELATGVTRSTAVNASRLVPFDGELLLPGNGLSVLRGDAPLRQLIEDTGGPITIAVAPQDTFAAIESSEGVAVYEPASPAVLTITRRRAAEPSYLGPFGRALVVRNAAGDLWAWSPGRAPRVVEDQVLVAYGFDSTGQRFAFGGGEAGDIHVGVVDVITGDVWRAEPPLGGVQPKFTPDGRFLVFVADDGQLILWDFEMDMSDAYGTGVRDAFRISADGSTVAALDPIAGEILLVTTTPRGSVSLPGPWTHLDGFSPDGDQLVASDGAGLVVIDVEERTQRRFAGYTFQGFAGGGPLLYAQDREAVVAVVRENGLTILDRAPWINLQGSVYGRGATPGRPSGLYALEVP